MKSLFIVAAVLLSFGKPVLAQNIKLPSIILSNVPFEMEWEGFSHASPENPAIVKGFAGGSFKITSPIGSADVKIQGNIVLEHPLDEGAIESREVSSIPGWLSLLPPLLANRNRPTKWGIGRNCSHCSKICQDASPRAGSYSIHGSVYLF